MHFAANPLELIRVLGYVTSPNVDENIVIVFTANGSSFTAENRSLRAGTVAMIFGTGQYQVSNFHTREILSELKRQYGRQKHPDNILVE